MATAIAPSVRAFKAEMTAALNLSELKGRVLGSFPRLRVVAWDSGAQASRMDLIGRRFP